MAFPVPPEVAQEEGQDQRPAEPCGTRVSNKLSSLSLLSLLFGERGREEETHRRDFGERVRSENFGFGGTRGDRRALRRQVS